MGKMMVKENTRVLKAQTQTLITQNKQTLLQTTQISLKMDTCNEVVVSTGKSTK